MINGDGSLIGIQLALSDQFRVSGFCGNPHVALDPGIGIIYRVGLDQGAIVILVLHDPGETQLSEIRQAACSLGFYFGPA